MKPETRMWKTRVRPILYVVPGLYYDRIETRTAVGVPDVAITTDRGHGWIELKVGHARDGMIDITTMTPQQYNWITQRGLRTGRVWVFVWLQGSDDLCLFRSFEILRRRIPRSKFCFHVPVHRALKIESALNQERWKEIIQEVM